MIAKKDHTRLFWLYLSAFKHSSEFYLQMQNILFFSQKTYGNKLVHLWCTPVCYFYELPGTVLRMGSTSHKHEVQQSFSRTAAWSGQAQGDAAAFQLSISRSKPASQKQIFNIYCLWGILRHLGEIWWRLQRNSNYHHSKS